MAAAKPGRGSDQFPLRLPEGLRDQIKEKADANGRSMNTEIVEAIEAALLGGGQEAELKRMLSEEHKAYTRAEALLEGQFQIITDYREMVVSASAQAKQYCGLLVSLSDIIIDLESAPDAAAKNLAARIGETARVALEALTAEGDIHKKHQGD